MLKDKKIKTLIHNKFAKGSHSIIWNADDELKNSVSPGIYFYNGFTIRKPVIKSSNIREKAFLKK
ncbi:MAG: hypothetical protein B6D62_03705 [Candidatus Cloacimonas sp. 4484_275]|nr:MAG: hypothetical protein B6D62_03705 [Candidatus Cloacimonas sp. 4484_275]